MMRRTLALLWLCALPLLALTLTAAPTLAVPVGVWGDHAFLTGVNGIERGGTEDYRWTDGDARLTLPNLGVSYRLLTLRAYGWRPDGLPSPSIRLAAGERGLGSIATSPTMRVYRALLPPPAGPQTVVGLASDSYTPPGDPRRIGFAIDTIAIGRVGGLALPGTWQLAGQAGLLALALALIGALRLGRAATLVAAAVSIAALLGANLMQPLWVASALWLWLAALGAILGLLALVNRQSSIVNRQSSIPRPQPSIVDRQSSIVNRQSSIVLALLTLALVVRLFGAVHPLFDARDLPVHTRWLATVASGELYLYSTPGELQNRKTFNPPAGYLLLAPLWLAIPDARLAVQTGTAIWDWLGCVFLLGVARELGLRRRASAIALAIYALLPINLTMLWWGFVTNDIAQSLWLALLWLVLRLARAPSRRDAALALAVGALTLTTHVGALVLVAATLGLLLLWGARSLPHRAWLTLLGVAAGALALTLPVYFAAAAAPLAGQRGGIELAASFARGLGQQSVRFAFVAQAYLLGFTPAVVALGLLGLWPIVARPQHPLARPLILGTALLSVVFCLTYVYLGLLTRYVYFGTPLLCLGAGAMLSRLWARPGGRVVAVALVTLVACLGAALWVAGVLLRVKPSLVPLTQ